MHISVALIVFAEAGVLYRVHKAFFDTGTVVIDGRRINILCRDNLSHHDVSYWADKSVK